MTFFTTTSRLLSFKIFSFITNLSLVLRTSILIVLLIGNKRLITVLDPSSSFLIISDNFLPEYIFDNFFLLSSEAIPFISSFLILNFLEFFQWSHFF